MQVAIVILNWNGKNWLEKFLPSVLQHSQDHRIIVADNASTDNSLNFLNANFPNVEIVRNSENGGFAKGYNEALKKINADYFLLLNSDVEVTEGWLEPLMAHLNDETIAGVQPKIKSYSQKTNFEYAGASGGFIDKYHYPFCRGRIFDSVETDSAQYEDSIPVFWTSGACMLIRARVYWEVGGLDERFFAHMEEIDLCWKAQRAGYQFVVEPKSVVYHVGGGTLSYSNPRKTFLNFRNSLFMITTNASLWWPFILFFRLGLDGIAGITYLFCGKWSHFLAVIKAHFSYYRNFRSCLRERKKWKHLPKKYKQGVLQASIIVQCKLRGKTSFKSLTNYFTN
jgi:GT2 family glycosyltransferase